MEFPLVRMGGFESELTRLQNHPIVARVLEIIGIDEFWTWGAIVLAVFATMASLINTAKFLIIRSQKKSTPVQLEEETEEESVSFSDYSDDELSSEEDEYPADQSGTREEGETMPVAIREADGSDFSWDFAKGNVVKFWDNIRVKALRSFDLQSQNVSFGLIPENLSWVSSGNSNGMLSLWDLNKEAVIRAFVAHTSQIPAICVTSPAVVVSGGVSDGYEKMGFKVWDARLGRQIPTAVAEWDSGSRYPQRRRILEINSGGVEKLFVRDDDRHVAVHDLRMIGDAVMPDSDDKTWWDADAVMVRDGAGSESEEERFRLEESPGNDAAGVGSGSVVSWCFNAVRSFSSSLAK